MINIEVYEHFAAWLDALLENNDMPEEKKAFNFNIYEDRSETGEPLYTLQLIAAGAFDPASGPARRSGLLRRTCSPWTSPTRRMWTKSVW